MVQKIIKKTLKIFLSWKRNFSGYKVESNLCVEECLSITNCATCKADHTTCATCDSGYKVESNLCVEECLSITNCATCEADHTTCATCGSGYDLSSQ